MATKSKKKNGIRGRKRTARPSRTAKRVMTGGTEHKHNNIPIGPMMKPMNAPIKPSEPGKGRKLGANAWSLITGNGWGRGRTRVKTNYIINSKRFKAAKNIYNSPEQQKIRNNYHNYKKRYEPSTKWWTKKRPNVIHTPTTGIQAGSSSRGFLGGSGLNTISIPITNISTTTQKTMVANGAELLSSTNTEF
jgi:hypothetical protein